jgi:hypothetical protein
LIVCDNTDTAEALYKLNTDKVQNFVVHPQLGDPIVPDANGVITHPYLSEIATASGTGKYCVISNSMNSCRYSINRIGWKSTIMETTTQNDISYTTTVAEEGEMEIHEPVGVSFYTTLSQICQGMKIEPTGMVLFLKTIFYGNPDHASDSVEVVDVRPMIFIMTDVNSTFGVDGSHHTLSFVSVKNGFAHSPQITNLGADVRISIPAGSCTINNALAALEASLNDRYDRYVKRVVDEYRKAGCDYDPAQHRKVKYRIIAEDGYVNDPAYIVDIYNDYIIRDPGNIIFHFGPHASIESCIDQIMLHSTKVTNDTDPNGNRIIYKIFSDIKTTADEMVVYYYIVKFVIFSQKQADGDLDPNAIQKELEDIKARSIEFDYIFTGKNTDIEENGLDMKMDLGFAFFQMLTMNGGGPPKNISEAITLDSVEPHTYPGPAGTVGKLNPGGRKNEAKTTLYPGGHSDDKIARLSGARNVVAYQRSLLSNFAAINNVAAAVTIAGNPNLIMGAAPDEKISGPDAFNRLFNIPMWVKINIKYPDSQYPEGNYTITDFWYTGYYMLLSIDNSFEGGLFKQTLGLVSQPVDAFVRRSDGSAKCSNTWTQVSKSVQDQIAAEDKNTPGTPETRVLIDKSNPLVPAIDGRDTTKIQVAHPPTAGVNESTLLSVQQAAQRKALLDKAKAANIGPLSITIDGNRTTIGAPASAPVPTPPSEPLAVTVTPTNTKQESNNLLGKVRIQDAQSVLNKERK